MIYETLKSFVLKPSVSIVTVSSLLAISILFCGCKASEKMVVGWPAESYETKPWTRWWWQGNALTKEGITIEMEAYKKAGIGGLEITPIYGVVGYEDKFIDFLSPQWMELLIHTLKEGERLNLGIDMATGTGWPFGGPWTTDKTACKNINYKTYKLSEGMKLNQKIEFIQKPFLRAIGSPVYPGHDGNSLLNSNRISIEQIKQPLSANKNLQQLAIEQIQFEKPLEMKLLMAYNDNGDVINLTSSVKDGLLQWTAPKGNWNLYALFEGFHGKLVERAGPGGEGDVIDHFSSNAVKDYLSHFDKAFKGNNIQSLRSFFNDSYEVDDAKGVANWTPTFFEDFQQLRGYDLKEHLPALLSNENINPRILCDYRETISELLLNNFTKEWKNWAHANNALVRNQAHGSPANILDLYSVVDIPEIEGIEPLRIKMASSAGNITGKKLVSSESATWLNEHFQSNLGDIKAALDRFMVNGVNHIFYHGTCYSPPNEPWPGWLFYAAVHLNPRNPLWNDFGTLNNYVTRCQSLLQTTRADNDVLLYYPIYDRFSAPGHELLEHFDGIKKQFSDTPFERAAETLQNNGYSFDYISDKQLADVRFENGQLITAGNSSYKTIVVPHCNYIPLETFKKLVTLADNGATILFNEGLPDSTSGFKDYRNNEVEFDKIKSEIRPALGAHAFKKTIGSGSIFVADSLSSLLTDANIRKETLAKKGISFIRKKNSVGNELYLLVNTTEHEISGPLSLQCKAFSAVLYNPMDGKIGSIKTTSLGDSSRVYLKIEPHQGVFINMLKEKNDVTPFSFYAEAGRPIPLTNPWHISFTSGGPTLPKAIETLALNSWTSFGTEYESFSGTAVYTLKFSKPSTPQDNWLLDLGSVNESASVTINGQPLGTAIGPPYKFYFNASILKSETILEVRVSNSMANRIAYMDRNKIFWKKFYNVNFPSRLPENRKNGIFDASSCSPKTSGLLGPVQIIPVKDLAF